MKRSRWRRCFGRGGEDQQGQPAPAPVGGDVPQMFAHGSRGAQVMVLVQEAIEAGPFGGPEQAHVYLVEQGLLVCRGLAPGLFHAPDARKVGRGCSEQKG
jgi:hypothetical protein